MGHTKGGKEGRAYLDLGLGAPVLGNELVMVGKQAGVCPLGGLDLGGGEQCIHTA